jgi:2-keto-4-pentenoate hydratase
MKRNALVTATVLLVFASLATSADSPPAWVEEFAARTYRAYRDGSEMPQLSAAHPQATLADGYAVQNRFIEHLLQDEKLGGFKSAIVGAAAQKRNQLDGPLTAVLPASGILETGARVKIDLADDPHRFVECEIGYIVGRTVEKRLTDIAVAKEKMRSIVAILEVPGGASEESRPVTMADLVARNINGKQIILGDRHDPSTVNPDEVRITLTHNGETVNKARGDQAAGGQWATLLKTINNLVGRGQTIRAGHVITNGALGQILPARVGRYRADFGPLGTVSFEVIDRAAAETTRAK